MNRAIDPMPDFEWPSPLRVAGTLSDTARIFRETVAELERAGLTPGLVLRTQDDDGTADSIRLGVVGSPSGVDCRLYPADRWQMRACIRALFGGKGRRVVHGSRAPIPDLTDANDELMFATDYDFRVGVDDLIREGCDAVLIGYGDTVHPCLDVVDQLLADGISIGLVGKPTLDVADEAMLTRLLRAPIVLLVEALPVPLGLDGRLRAWLDARGYTGTYGCIGPGDTNPGRMEVPNKHAIKAELTRLLDARPDRITARALTRDGLIAEAKHRISLDGPERADLPPPKTLGSLDHRLAAKLGRFQFETPFAAELADIRLVGPQALGFTADGRPILETAANRIDILGRTLSRIPPALHQAAAVDRIGLACSLVNLWSPLYAHWLLEGLTRLEAWEAYTEATGERPALIIDRDPPGWVRESLRLMGVDPDACLQWPMAGIEDGPVAVERLVVCSKRREHGRVSARALSWVRERVLANLPPEPSPHPRRIFITRADSRFRQIVDEDALLVALEPLGFERVRLSTLPWPEQIRLFRDVEAVVAAHGAGMTNIMFSTRQPVVVELFGQKVSHMNYTVGLGIGCDQRVLCCAPRGDDLLVDVDALRRLIEA